MKIIEKKIIWEGKFLRTVVLTYSDHKGVHRKWEAVERTNCSGVVVIVAITPSGELLLIRQFRPVMNGFVIELPAGLSDRGEDLKAAAHRELIEETGYTAREFSFLAEGPVSSGMSTETLTVILAADAVPAPDDLKALYPPEENENIEVIKTPVEKISEVLETFKNMGDFVDLKIYGLAEIAKNRIDFR